MKVLLPASEVAPIIKLGGLGDVIGSLPKALQDIGVNIDVIVPFYSLVRVSDFRIYKSLEISVPFGGEIYTVGVYRTKLPGSDVDVFLLKNDRFFASGGESAFADNISETEMFVFFNKAVVEFIKSQFNTYDLVHCNDWHTGLITHLLKDELTNTRPATLFTIHNVMYQGVGDYSIPGSAGLTPGDHPLIDWDLQDGDINMMLQGITSSDYINAVSGTYARELLTPEFGGGFSDILQSRRGRLSGILNGVDYSALPRNYDVHDAVAGKLAAKKALYEKIGPKQPLDVWLDMPVFSFIGRLDSGQKGLDLLEGLFENFRARPYFILLGKGDFAWEEKFKKMTHDNLSVNIVFDEDSALSIYAGSDFLLVPSKYEPCGLIQMMAMWYGTLPVVRGVGGLKDSVKNGVTGFVFEGYNLSDFVSSVEKALAKYKEKDKLTVMIKNAMKEDFSWAKSALEYKRLYEKVVKMRRLASGLAE